MNDLKINFIQSLLQCISKYVLIQQYWLSPSNMITCWYAICRSFMIQFSFHFNCHQWKVSQIKKVHHLIWMTKFKNKLSRSKVCNFFKVQKHNEFHQYNLTAEFHVTFWTIRITTHWSIFSLLNSLITYLRMHSQPSISDYILVYS